MVEWSATRKPNSHYLRINHKREVDMRWVANIIGIILLLVGIIWILQGVNVLPGSFMTGNILYAVLGFIRDMIGIGLLFYANRRKRMT